jgi:hypothetical protein
MSRKKRWRVMLNFVCVFLFKIFLVCAVCDRALHYVGQCAVADRAYKAAWESQFQTDPLPG